MDKALNKYSGNIGNFILIVGFLHIITGLIENRSVTIDILQSGIIDSVNETSERYSFYWFEMSGLFVLFIGSFLQDYLDEYKKPIPRKYGYYLLIISVIGCLLELVSGFYVFTVIAVLMIITGNRNFTAADSKKQKLPTRAKI